MPVRVAVPQDADAIVAIYNQGIEDRLATFETRLRAPEEVRRWFDGVHPIVVLEEQQEVRAFASTSVYRARLCYAGVAEFSIYVQRERRGQGLGKQVLVRLLHASFW